MIVKDYLELLKKSDQTVNPLFTFLGIKVDEISEDITVLSVELKEEFIQGGGVTAGGILATLADEAMAHVVLANLDQGINTATIEMNMRFMRPVKTGEIKAEARVVKKGRKVLFVESDVVDQAGKMLAQAGASFMVI